MRMRVRSALLAMLLAAVMPAGTRAQDCSISVDAGKSLGQVSPYVYGQFIEYMGKCIDGGIYEEGSPLSDSLGIRTDVLEKVRELAPTMLRFPGGTVVKTLHWEDGVGPREQRRAKKNLVWGGINTFHFGTCEFIDYCRQVGCEPVLVVNIATGTPDEAANWVDYCNGTGDTYYANLRRQHGYPEPFHPQIRNYPLQHPSCVYMSSLTELADKLRQNSPLQPSISPYPTMRLEAIRSIIPISCRRYPKSV